MDNRFLQKKDNALSSVNDNPLSNSATTINLPSGHGAKFPATADGYWVATLWDKTTYPNPGDDANMEKVLVTARSTDALTVVRAYDGTTGVSHAQGSALALLDIRAWHDEYEKWLPFWKPVLGTVARVGNTSFSTTGDYSLLLSKGVVVKWTESGAVKQAVIIASSYSNPTLTVTIMGDTMASIDAGSLRYSSEKAQIISFAIVGTMATGTNIAGVFYAPRALKIFGADARVATAPTGATLIFDINVGGTTKFTAKPTIAASATSSVNNPADNGSTASDGDAITVDVDQVGSTVPGVDAYISLYVAPYANIYLT